MKYRVLKKTKYWEVGDIVSMNNLAAEEAVKSGFVEIYSGDEPSKHVWVMADPLLTKSYVQKI